MADTVGVGRTECKVFRWFYHQEQQKPCSQVAWVVASFPRPTLSIPLSLQAVSPCFSASCAPLTPFSQKYTDNISMATKN